MKGRMEFPVFGTIGVLVVADDARLYEARQAVDDVLGRVDQTCSRFRPDSDLERVNAGAGRAVAADPLLLDAVDVALRAARRTGGAVDPTIGQALRVLGYDRDFASLEVGGPPTTVRIVPVAGWRQVMVDRTAGTICVPAGTRLDLGATAKAWAADRAAGAACRRAGCGVLLSLGGDMAVAGPAPAGGWNVQLADWCGEDLDDAGGSDHGRRLGYFGNHGAALAGRRPAGPPHHRPDHLAARRHTVADGHRGRQFLPRRQRCRHRRPGHGRRGAILVGRTPSARPSGGPRRRRHLRGRLARCHGGGGVNAPARRWVDQRGASINGSGRRTALARRSARRASR